MLTSRESQRSRLIQKLLVSGGLSSVEEVIRRALESLDADESWTVEERSALDDKIEGALKQVAEGKVYGPQAALRRLSLLRETHLANRRTLRGRV